MKSHKVVNLKIITSDTVMLIHRLTFTTTASLFSFKQKLFSTSSVKSRDWATIMGKIDPNLKHIQKQRLEKREKRSQDPATCAFFQILGNGASGGPKSIFMFTDYNRYLFNCGEATQKIFCEHTNHKSLGQVSSIFITKRNWDNMGGLPGMSQWARKFKKFQAKKICEVK